MRRLFLIRHALPDFGGAERRCLGLSDPPLSIEGRAQAEALALKLKGLHISVLYSSPLLRARQTGETAGFSPLVREGLREADAGLWDGLRVSEIREKWPRLWAARFSADFVPPGGESLPAALRRFRSALDGIMEESKGDIAVVSHATVMQCFLCSLMGLELQEGRQIKIPHCGILEFYYDGEFHLKDSF